MGVVAKPPDPELARILEEVRLRPARRVAAAVVDPDRTAPPRWAFIGADPRTPFEIGSITKGLTGLLLADAIDRGEVALDTTVGSVLPGTAGSPLGSVTVQQLCTHTSGLPRVPRTPLFGLRAVVLFGLLGLDPYRGTSPAQVIRAARRQRLRHSNRYGYSNLGGAVLGQLLSAATATEYGALLSGRVLDPLGMVDSRVATRATAAPSGRSALGLPRMPWVLDGFAPAGGVVSTLADMTRLAVALLTGHTGHGQPTPGLAALDPIAGVATGVAGRRTGMFWVLDTAPGTGQARIWHNGGTGGYSAFLGLYPQARRAIVVLASSARGADTQRIAAALGRRFVGDGGSPGPGLSGPGPR